MEIPGFVFRCCLEFVFSFLVSRETGLLRATVISACGAVTRNSNKRLAEI